MRRDKGDTLSQTIVCVCVCVWKGCAARLFFFSFFLFSPVQQTTSGIGHRVKSFFRGGNQYVDVKNNVSLQPMFPPKPFDCSGGCAAFRSFLNKNSVFGINRIESRNTYHAHLPTTATTVLMSKST